MTDYPLRVLSRENLWYLSAGTVIRTSRHFYDHVGMLAEGGIAGERKVVDFAPSRGFSEIPLSAFAQGQSVLVEGYLGGLSSELVLRRARSLHERRYSWLMFNCEHFVREAHGVVIESPQLQQWIQLGGIVALGAMLARA